MKKIWVICFLCLLWAPEGYSRDFIVEFVEENYSETQAQFSYDPLIYHSIQVNSSAGPKILILTGNDYNYRKWLRHYIAQDKKFITKIEDERIDEFISAKAYEIDVSLLHPFNGDKWFPQQIKDNKKGEIQGVNNILIIDPNEKRTHLIMTVIKKMGYDAAIFPSAQKALDVFRLQPERFKMVMVHHDTNDMQAEDVVAQLIKTDHMIPVILDVGYKNETIKDDLEFRFSGSKSVHLKSVILRELPKTIKTLMKESV